MTAFPWFSRKLKTRSGERFCDASEGEACDFATTDFIIFCSAVCPGFFFCHRPPTHWPIPKQLYSIRWCPASISPTCVPRQSWWKWSDLCLTILPAWIFRYLFSENYLFDRVCNTRAHIQYLSISVHSVSVHFCTSIYACVQTSLMEHPRLVAKYNGYVGSDFNAAPWCYGSFCFGCLFWADLSPFGPSQISLESKLWYFRVVWGGWWRLF